jgi:hypothetical protein
VLHAVIWPVQLPEKPWNSNWSGLFVLSQCNMPLTICKRLCTPRSVHGFEVAGIGSEQRFVGFLTQSSFSGAAEPTYNRRQHKHSIGQVPVFFGELGEQLTDLL